MSYNPQCWIRQPAVASITLGTLLKAIMRLVAIIKQHTVHLICIWERHLWSVIINSDMFQWKQTESANDSSQSADILSVMMVVKYAQKVMLLFFVSEQCEFDDSMLSIITDKAAEPVW